MKGIVIVHAYPLRNGQCVDGITDYSYRFCIIERFFLNWNRIMFFKKLNFQRFFDVSVKQYVFLNQGIGTYICSYSVEPGMKKCRFAEVSDTIKNACENLLRNVFRFNFVFH